MVSSDVFEVVNAQNPWESNFQLGLGPTQSVKVGAGREGTRGPRRIVTATD